jgi:hypothetical protein
MTESTWWQTIEAQGGAAIDQLKHLVATDVVHT